MIDCLARRHQREVVFLCLFLFSTRRNEHPVPAASSFSPCSCAAKTSRLQGDVKRTWPHRISRSPALNLESRDNLEIASSDKSKPTDDTSNSTGIRLNKVFKVIYSRRQADELIRQGRVSINGETVTSDDIGRRVLPYQDIVAIDNQVYRNWEPRVLSQELSTSSSNLTSVTPPANEEYIKFWKPVGVTSTTDRGIPGNLLEALEQSNGDITDRQPIRHRIFSIGRLDKDTSGLILLTSDGRIPNSALQKSNQHVKTYLVELDRIVSERHLQQLRNGIIITTDTVRNKRHVPFTARTLPCSLDVVSRTCDVGSLLTSALPLRNGRGGSIVQISLVEGRNRQIRIMFASLGYTVVALHRTTFMGIGLHPLTGPGEWTRLTPAEVKILTDAVGNASRAS
jgi:23S rRNA pseudouridine2604 synthase